MHEMALKIPILIGAELSWSRKLPIFRKMKSKKEVASNLVQTGLFYQGECRI